jgi:pimeloyl-ACP methyl ester carboxylesterase
MSTEPFAAVAPRLAERGFRVLSIEPPYGDDLLPSSLARRVLALADDPLVFVGASWGAVIGLHLAAGHPDRVDRLVLLDGGHVDVKAPWWLRRRDIRGVVREPPSSTYARLDRPTLLVLAGRNPPPPGSGVPGATTRTIDAGHDLLADAPDETIALVTDWLG